MDGDKLKKTLPGIAIPVFGDDNAKIGAAFAELREFSRRFEAALSEFGSFQESLSGIVGEPFFGISDLEFRIGDAVSCVSERLLAAQKGIFDRLPNRTKDATIKLAQRGWYVDMDMHVPMIMRLADFIDACDLSSVDQVLVSYFDEKVSEVGCSLCEKFPKRAGIIGAAIRAHQGAEYFLSVPVFFAQADGIGKELTGSSFFIKDKKTRSPRTKCYVDSLDAGAFEKALHAPLAENTAIVRETLIYSRSPGRSVTALRLR